MNARLIYFGVIGLSGFAIDSSVTLLLIGAELSPLTARIPAILLAMTFTWLCNRRFTFAVEQKPRVAEAARYFTVAALAAMLNYLLYTGMVLAAIPPFAAIVVATGMVTVFSYLSYKKFAFGIG